MSFSDYTEDKLLDHLLKTAAFTQPAAIYVALSTADPLDDGSGLAEPGVGAYARTQNDVWDPSSAGSASNTGAITFPEATASWGTITHFALFDAVSGGNMLGHGALTTSKTIDSGDTAQFAAGDITVTLD